MKILIADDDSVSLRLLFASLERWGYEPVVCEDGDEAWSVLTGVDPPRLALLDWMMPGLSGPEICGRLRELRSESYTYALLLTTRAQKADLVAGLEAGADDYLTKPFHPDELRVRLRVGRRILDIQEKLLTAQSALRELAIQDPLTKLWNRRMILDFLDRELLRAARDQTSVAVIMADLDRFKEINDQYGHQTGDTVLGEVAQRMASVLRKYDGLGRYGGEEFLIVLPDCDREHGLETAERLRQELSSKPVASGGESVQVRSSFGVEASTGGSSVDASDLIRGADRALYRAKRLGRDRVEFSNESR